VDGNYDFSAGDDEYANEMEQDDKPLLDEDGFEMIKGWKPEDANAPTTEDDSVENP